MNMTILILLYTALAFIVSRIPFVGAYLSLCNMLICEVTTKLCLKDKKIRLNKDPGMPSNGIQSTITVYAGYTVSSLATIGLFYFITRGQENLVLYIIIGFMLITLIIWIRTLFGAIWTLSFIILLAVPIYFRWGIAIVHISIFLASTIFVHTIMKSFLLLKQSISRNGAPRSPRAIIPAVFLNLVLFIQSLYAGYFIFTSILS